jgi:ubiquinone/menaquinone biosynthesis C-methylase UbiE
VTTNSPGLPDAARERARWTASGPVWDRWSDPMADMADRLNLPLLDACGVMPGEMVLDLASGAGEPALSAAKRVGPGGHVIGIDFVPAMLAGAIRRAAEFSGTRPDFIVGDMTTLPFADGQFDRVTCRFGIMFVPDTRSCLAEAARVLHSHGKAAFMVWGPLRDNTLFSELDAAVSEVIGPDPEQGLQPLFRFEEPGILAEMMTEAGFRNVTEESLRPTARVPLDKPFWRASLDMLFAPRLASAPEGSRERIEDAVRAHFSGVAVEGVCPLHLHAKIVAGEIG